MADVTELRPESIAADQEPIEVKASASTYRVLKAVDSTPDGQFLDWQEVASEFVAPGGYKPDAEDIGVAFGEGDYLLIETDSKYSHHWTYMMRVVADRRFREADE